MRKQTRAILMLAGITLSGVAGAQAQKNPPATKKTDVTPATISQPVTGAGTSGQITKWTGAGPTSNAVGESIITEDKFANIGVGTTTPTSKLTVVGTIETMLGGVKFPDGSTQTTAGISSVTHDSTLAGNGILASPLGIAPGGVGPLQLASAAVTSPKIAPAAVSSVHIASEAVTSSKIAPATVVRSLNGLFENLNLAPGSNITITPSGNSLTIAAPGAFSSVSVTPPITGNGTSQAPLGLAAGSVETGHLAPGSVTAAKLKTPTSPAAGQMLGFDGAALQWVTPVTPPSQQPFQAAFELDDSQQFFFLQVPANKRLVIEFVSLYSRLELNGDWPKFIVPVVTTSLNSQEVRHFLAAGTPRDDNQGPGFPRILHYSISQPTRLYADPGTLVRLYTYGISLNITAGSISGYLLDAVQ